jgi:hypothetical protein
MRLSLIKHIRDRALQRFLIIFALLFFFTSHSIAQETKEKKKKKEDHFEVKVGLGSFYDDNILKYSDKYLERFMNNEDTGRFHIKTYDDLIINPSLQFAYSFRLIGKQKSKINADYSYSNYIVNNIKNWQSFGIGFQQSFLKKASFRLSYSYIPDFYVRHFRDADLVEYLGYVPETYVPYSFSKENYGFWIQNSFLKSTRVRLSLNYAQYFHNAHYYEYNCKNLAYGINISQKLNKKLAAEASFEYTTSDANGYDGYQPGESKGNSDDANASYHDNEFTAGMTWQLPKILKLNHEIDLGGLYDVKFYTTNYLLRSNKFPDQYFLDDEHCRRIDHNLSLVFTYSLEISKSLDISLFYKYYSRNSSAIPGENSDYVSEEKDYRQNQVGLEIDYSLKF